MRRKEKMMKKLLIFMLVLGLASVSQATLTTLVVGGNQQYSGTAGETISIDLIADTVWSGAVLSSLVEASEVDGDEQALASNVVNMGGVIATPTTSTTGVTIDAAGYALNYLGNLYVSGAASANPAVTAGTVTLSFDYTLPSTISSDYWVTPLKPDELFYYSGGSFAVEGTYSNLAAVNVPIEGLHIIPEPMTICLLGLGGLFLRRRKK